MLIAYRIPRGPEVSSASLSTGPSIIHHLWCLLLLLLLQMPCQMCFSLLKSSHIWAPSHICCNIHMLYFLLHRDWNADLWAHESCNTHHLNHSERWLTVGFPLFLYLFFFQSFSCVNRDQSVHPALFVDGRCTTVSKHDCRLGRRATGQRVGKELFALLPSCLLFQHLAADGCALSGLRLMFPDVHVAHWFDVHFHHFIRFHQHSVNS